MSENPILDELVYDESTGSLSFKGVRYLLMRPETIAGFQKAVVENCGPRAAENFFDGGFNGGRLSTQKYRELHGFSDTEVIDFMMNMGSQIGWGDFRLLAFEPADRLLSIAVKNSAIARAYGESSQSVCHLIRGVLAGMAVVLFDGDCRAEEVECLARGDAVCRFVIEG